MTLAAARSQRGALRAATLAAALAALPSACRRDPAALPFEGARPFELPALARGETPSLAEIEALLARLVEVAGGRERLAALSSRRVEDLHLVRTGDLLGNRMVATTLVRPDQSVRVHLEYQGGDTESRVMLKREEHVHPRYGMRQLATGSTQQIVEWDWELARLPVNLLDAERLDPLPPEQVDGRWLAGVDVKLPGLNPPFSAWIDPAGPLLVEVRTRLPVTADLSLRAFANHRQRFSDWRRVDGLLLCHRREIYVDDQRIGLAETRSWELDLEITDADLLPGS